MMRADYDSEADALSIALRRFKRYDHQEQAERYELDAAALTAAAQAALAAPDRLVVMDVAERAAV
jgi:hypothetical protein